MIKFSLNYREPYVSCTTIEPGAASGKLIVFGFRCLSCGKSNRFNTGYYLERRPGCLEWKAGIKFACRYCHATHVLTDNLDVVCKIEIDALVCPEGDYEIIG